MQTKILNFVEAISIVDILVSKTPPKGSTLMEILMTLSIHEIIKIGEAISVLPNQANEGMGYIERVRDVLEYQQIMTLCQNFPHLIGKSNAQ